MGKKVNIQIRFSFVTWADNLEGSHRHNKITGARVTAQPSGSGLSVEHIVINDLIILMVCVGYKQIFTKVFDDDKLNITCPLTSVTLNISMWNFQDFPFEKGNAGKTHISVK